MVKTKTKAMKTKDSEHDLKNQLARALADYDNLKKRTEIERGQFIKIANLGLVARLLPVLDMLDSAQVHLKDSGLAIAIKEFQATLSETGVEEIETKTGDKFDEKIHEAVETGPGKTGQIVEVVQKGYRMKDGPVVRHVRVRVGGGN